MLNEYSLYMGNHSRNLQHQPLNTKEIQQCKGTLSMIDYINGNKKLHSLKLWGGG